MASGVNIAKGSQMPGGGQTRDSNPQQPSRRSYLAPPSLPALFQSHARAAPGGPAVARMPTAHSAASHHQTSPGVEAGNRGAGLFQEDGSLLYVAGKDGWTTIAPDQMNAIRKLHHQGRRPLQIAVSVFGSKSRLAPIMRILKLSGLEPNLSKTHG